MNLMIVESPAKSRTISKFLGSDWKVVASYGHVRDLPKKVLGVDPDHNFEPKYQINFKSRKIIKEIRELAHKAKEIYLATDYDREGEAIAWHLMVAIGNGNFKSTEGIKRELVIPRVNRITFHEITNSAINQALKKPRGIDLNLVDAQQARRILDRLVGYKLSPFLWHKVASGLSAGRVQSIALRLVVEREREIEQFVPEESWSVDALFQKQSSKTNPFPAKLEKIDEKSIKIVNEKEAQDILKSLDKANYEVRSIEQSQKLRSPSPPFITSTIQQEAYQKLRFSAKQTMKIAQDLYEGMELGSEGSVGLITYMRTDSFQMSAQSVEQARQVILAEFGQQFLPKTSRVFKTKVKAAQEAHEAIRPTSFLRKPQDVKPYLDHQHFRLYQLIWERAIASQMAEAVLDQTRVEIVTSNLKKVFLFIALGSIIKFPGFLKVYQEEEDEKSAEVVIIPPLKEKEPVDLKELLPNQHFTQAPPRYTDASLVKELEKRGIGRPSTYAPILSTIVDRGYVKKMQGKYMPQDIGVVVNDLLVEHFPRIVDDKFTAQLEEELDQIAAGKMAWQPMVGEFYGPFSRLLAEKSKEVKKADVIEEKTDEKCPQCGAELVIKLGRFGRFYACKAFPKCKYTKPYLDEQASRQQEQELAKEIKDEKCPKCGSLLMLREGRFGTFLACPKFPKCRFTKSIDLPSGVKCPECNSEIVKKTSRRGKVFWGCSSYPKCKFLINNEPIKEKCPKCSSLLTIDQSKVVSCSKCDFQEKADQKILKEAEPAREL